MDMKEKTLPANLENLASFQAFISQCAQTFGIAEPIIQKMQLAAEEALVNIFNYAYPEETKGDVTVTCSLASEGEFKIQMEDRGRPFDMLAKDDPDTTLSIDDRAVGGLGIFFIKQMMDRVDYRRDDGKNILTLVLSFN
ncbi:MAG TPA: ATP-binding protein [Desulfobacteraceae bacterium]|nr:ATP-binding protein [Desulfobacteraceae bacterium]|tara:strand:+ start:439 stop:855 length:417 start_codon:yes stop_codon:yes gene_type:complete